MSLNLEINHLMKKESKGLGMQADLFAHATGIWLIIFTWLGFYIHDLSDSVTRYGVACAIGICLMFIMRVTVMVFANAVVAHRKPKESKVAAQIRDAFDYSDVEIATGESKLSERIRETLDVPDLERDGESNVSIAIFSPVPEDVNFHANEGRERRFLDLMNITDKWKSVVDGESVVTKRRSHSAM